MRIYSWNVNGLRAALRKGAFQGFVQKYQPDVLCLQETKAKQGQAEVDLPEYEEYWCSALRPGYSGTAIFSKQRPQSVRYGFPEEIDKLFDDFADSFGDARTEGRVITGEFDDFFLINTYVPNSKAPADPSRLALREQVWDKALLNYMKLLERDKPVVLCGDMNVAHQEIDLARPKQNTHNAGFTTEERRGMTNFLNNGFIDTFRALHPDEQKFSWWSYRANARVNNVGWRIDYFLASETLRSRIKRAEILDEVMGSDHCPIMLELD